MMNECTDCCSTHSSREIDIGFEAREREACDAAAGLKELVLDEKIGAKCQSFWGPDHETLCRLGINYKGLHTVAKASTVCWIWCQLVKIRIGYTWRCWDILKSSFQWRADHHWFRDGAVCYWFLVTALEQSCRSHDGWAVTPSLTSARVFQTYNMHCPGNWFKGDGIPTELLWIPLNKWGWRWWRRL